MGWQPLTDTTTTPTSWTLWLSVWVVGDGAMGTQLQAADLTLDDFNGRRRCGRDEIRWAAVWLTSMNGTSPTRSASWRSRAPRSPSGSGRVEPGVQTSRDDVDFSGREALQRFRFPAGSRHARAESRTPSATEGMYVNGVEPNIRPDCTDELTAALRQRIMVIDGAMGTAIQRDRPDEAGYRGERFIEWPTALQGNNDLLNLTQPQIIEGIHREYLEAGADILETNTFNANAVSLSDYDMHELAYELNYAGAALARAAADEFSTPEKPRYVAGAIGPTTRTASISPDVNDPGARNVSYDQLVAALPRSRQRPDRRWLRPPHHRDDLRFAERQGGGCVRRRDAVRGPRTPLGRSSSRAPSPMRPGGRCPGQVTEAFWNAIRHAKPIAVGLNCALGAPEMRPYIAEMSRIADTFVSCYPNAGPANAFGEYDESPERQAGYIAEFAAAGLVNLVGGCCGTAPPHIAEIAKGRRGQAAARGCRRSRWQPGSRAWSRSTSPTTPCS